MKRQYTCRATFLLSEADAAIPDTIPTIIKYKNCKLFNEMNKMKNIYVNIIEIPHLKTQLHYLFFVPIFPHPKYYTHNIYILLQESTKELQQ
jgi:desulfoferrodoxin (superoxide reductase-like protein)